MIPIDKPTAEALIKFFHNQFIDRNSTKLYDGELVHRFLQSLTNFVEGSCGARHINGYDVCDREVNHYPTTSHRNSLSHKVWEE